MISKKFAAGKIINANKLKRIYVWSILWFVLKAGFKLKLIWEKNLLSKFYFLVSKKNYCYALWTILNGKHAKKKEKLGEASSCCCVVTTNQKSVSTFSQTIFSFSCCSVALLKAFSHRFFLSLAALSVLARNKIWIFKCVCDIFVDFLKTWLLFLYILTIFWVSYSIASRVDGWLTAVKDNFVGISFDSEVRRAEKYF
jgi:hypothetical protein